MMDPPDDTTTKSGIPAITKGSTHRTRRLAIIGALTLLIFVGPVPVGAQVTDTRSDRAPGHAVGITGRVEGAHSRGTARAADPLASPAARR